LDIILAQVKKKYWQEGADLGAAGTQLTGLGAIGGLWFQGRVGALL